ncbi:MAG TPA: hypothetical protein VGH91_14835 [Gammaproteobacteria bacterium]|jgi:hypothetical protein
MRATSGKLLICLYATSVVLMGCMPAGNASSPSIQAKISAPVAAAKQELEKGETLGPGARTDAQGRLQVYVYVTDTSADTLTRLTEAGLTGITSSADMGLVQGWIATQDLLTLARLLCVRNITLPRYASSR